MFAFSGLEASDSSLGRLLLEIVPQLIIVFLIFPVLQYFTCRVAYHLGDDSPEMLERLTLNPLAHVDLIGAFALLFCRIGWPKPLPINPANFYKVKDRRTGMMLVSFAGPVGNLISAFIFIFLATLMARFDSMINYSFISFTVSLFRLIAQLSISIALFCCLPLPGLPGEGIGEYFFPDMMTKMRGQRIVIAIGIVFIFFMAPQVLAPLGALGKLILLGLNYVSIFIIAIFEHLINFIVGFFK